MNDYNKINHLVSVLVLWHYWLPSWLAGWLGFKGWLVGVFKGIFSTVRLYYAMEKLTFIKDVYFL